MIVKIVKNTLSDYENYQIVLITYIEKYINENASLIATNIIFN